MNGKEALEKYGYKEVGGVYLRVLGANFDLTTERWKAVEGGFECYKTDGAWGRETSEPGVYQVPWKQSDEFATVGGLHPASNPQCFVWVWPDEVVAFQYEHAGEEGWLKTTDAEGNVVSMTREKS